MHNIPKLMDMCTQVRRDILRMIFGACSGHPGGALGCVELLVALFFAVMNYKPERSKNAKGEDVFILSNGHICAVLYSVMARKGLIDLSELSSFRKLGSRLQGHPANKYLLPTIYTSTGSLGQGLSVAAGIAFAKCIDQDNSKVFCLTGDGELQEGQIWEALLFISHYKLNNLIIIVDYNEQQIDGKVSQVISLGNLQQKFISFCFEVVYEKEGNNLKNVIKSLRKAKKNITNNPIVIILKTEMGKGVDFMEGTHLWHGQAPTKEQLQNALAQLKSPLQDY